MNDVLIVNFDDLAGARAAMSELRRLDREGAVKVRAAAVVARQDDGRFWVPEDEERIGFAGTATGGAVGAVLGALIGPVGVLLFGATGALVGSLADAEEADVSEDVLASVTRQMPPGSTVVVADVDEPAPRIVDAVMDGLDGTVTRRPRAAIEAELEAAEAARRAARSEAERVLRERRRAAGEETIGDRLQELKEAVRPGR